MAQSIKMMQKKYLFPNIEEDVGNSSYYDDIDALIQVTSELKALPDLVNYQDIDGLTCSLEQASHKKSFIFQAGDCAERFSDAKPCVTQQKYDQLILLKTILEEALQRDTIVIGRIAGQYAKPRSNPMETIGNKLIYAYHGDMINSENQNDNRQPDPDRMRQAYAASGQVLASLTSFQQHVYTSHECFLLEYEKPLTRIRNNRRYNIGAHLLWLGMRNIESEPHIKYLASIENPIAIKVGPGVKPETVLSVLRRINPENKMGKIILIARLGTSKVKTALPELVKIIQKHQLHVIWMSDPMHGNIQQDQYRKKFRLLSDAVEETIQSSFILKEFGEHLSGLHLEISPKSTIKECISSLDELTPHRVYESAVDPRFNHEQSIAFVNQILGSL